MPSLNNRALLLQLEAFVADNNIRRSVLTTATNALSIDGVLNDRSLNVAPALETPLSIECVPNNKTTVFRCVGGPLTVSAKFGTNVLPVEFEVLSMWVMSTPITELTVTNPGSRVVQLRIIQT